MKLLHSKIEGKGNGIKTVIVNMTDIAKSLSRPPMYPTKFFGCELGAQVKGDEKTDRYIVNVHSAPLTPVERVEKQQGRTRYF